MTVFIREATVRVSGSLKNNPRTSLTHLNLSDNPLDDRGEVCVDEYMGCIISLVQLWKLLAQPLNHYLMGCSALH